MYKNEMNSIMKGKPFYPLSAFRNKLFLYIITTFVVVTTSIVAFGGMIAFFVSLDKDTSKDDFGRWINANTGNILSLYLLVSLVLMVIAAILVVI